MRQLFFVLLLTVFSSPDIFAQQPPADARAEALTLDIHVLQIVLNDEHRDGVDWEAIISDFHNLSLRKEDNPAWSDQHYRLSVGTLSNEDYAVLLDALDTVGKVIALPQESVRLSVDEPLVSTLNLGEDKGQVIRLQLRFDPSAKPGPALVMEPNIEVMSKESTKLPLALSLRAKTQVEIKENTTIVLGGLTEEVEITTTRKFPLLGNLPLLGLVFRSQGHWVQKTETVIFVTPHMAAVAPPEEAEGSNGQ